MKAGLALGAALSVVLAADTLSIATMEIWGHALTHRYHGAAESVSAPRRSIPSLSTGALVAAITAFMIGGLVVSLAGELGPRPDAHAQPVTPVGAPT